MENPSLLQALTERILILDGAMGTMLQRHSLTEEDFRGERFRASSKELKGNNECLNITRPEIIYGIHKAYIEAGADIIETNTFSANRISQSEYETQDAVREMALEGARLARRAADEAPRKVWVAGSVGPTGKSLSLASDISQPAYRTVDFNAMAAAYREQIEALVEGGVDLILVETCFDALNVKAAIYALRQISIDMPLIVSVAVSDRSGRALTGQTLDAFYTSVKHAPLLAFGMNCSFGAADLEHLVDELAPAVDCAFSFYPNAGLPNEMGQYDETPEVIAAAVRKIAQDGMLNIAGGCCGTTPEHISALVEAVRGIQPRRFASGPEAVQARMTVSGLESVTIDKALANFTNIGERTNVAGSRKFARLIASGAYDEALQVAAGQIADGASVIDINVDDAMLDSPKEMMTFLRCISNDPAVAKAALMIDSSHFETILAGLKNAQGKCIVNSISLKEGEAAFLSKAREIKALGGAMVVMAFDEEGQATTYERKIEICERAYRLLTRQAGVQPSDIIFDVNVLSIGTGIAEHARYGVDFIEAVRWIKNNLPGALTSGGISNLSFAFRGNNPVREAMHSAFLYHATAAGLDMGIVNPAMLQIYDDIEPEMLRRVEDVIFDTDPDATERLIAKASAVAEELAALKAGGAPAEAKAAQPESMDVESRLVNALVKGQGAGLEADILEALAIFGKPVDVIEGPLMAGMEKVGKLFGEGKMFLPQVVKSAKIMRDAVDVLQPYMEKDSGSDGASSRPKVVIATVKGDVHDIGKNITAIVLSCNGFDVTDLGVMVPEETILDEAERIGADIVGASGLITPSLARMEELCRKMKERGMTIPLMIGGATTSALHTAVKLAPLYDHVYYGADASASAVMAKKYMMDPDAFEQAEHEAQQRIRDIYEGRVVAADDSPVPEAFPLESYLKGRVFQDMPAMQLSVDEVLPYFEWRMLYTVWGFKYGAADTPETDRLKADAQQTLAHFREHGCCRIMIAARFLDCTREGDDIVSGDLLFPMLRQVEGQKRSLADYVSPDGSQMGLFAISVTRTGHGAGCDCEQCSTDYEPMLERSVRLTLAEAASSWLDERLKAMIPAERQADMKIVKPAAGYSSCPDHTLKRDILPLLPDGDKLGISFTESYAMIPDASICGFIFAHPEATYPEIRHVPASVVREYALRRGFNDEEARIFLGHLLK